MQEPNLFLIFLKPLAKLNIPYMVTGATAAIIYGAPRLTLDLDLVIQLELMDIDQFIILFPGKVFYIPPEEVIKVEVSRLSRGHFNIIHHDTGFKADVYISGEDPLHNWGMQNRKSYSIQGETIWVAPPEYVILRKLEYYREGKSNKHIQDIRNILSVSSEQIDFQFLEKTISDYALEKEWKIAGSK